MIPEAIVHGLNFRKRFGAWLKKVSRRALQAGAVSGVLGAAYGLSQAGCKNDAITYAHAVWPEAHCDALSTSATGLSTDPDTAVCRIGDKRLMCTAGFRSEEPNCKEIKK